MLAYNTIPGRRAIRINLLLLVPAEEYKWPHYRGGEGAALLLQLVLQHSIRVYVCLLDTI